MRAHLAISSTRYFWNSTGVIVIGSAPCSFQAFFTSARATTFVSSALSRYTTARGVPAGAISPIQMVAS